MSGITSYLKKHHLPHPHIGMRKAKSILAIFIGFCMWQTIRLFLPELEVHPLFIYIYGMIEIRETSDKTRAYGNMRIRATFTAIGVGLPFMALLDYLENSIVSSSGRILVEITLLLIGALIVLCVAEVTKCKNYCGLAAAIYIILMVSHIDSSMYLYSVMRAFQTIFGVMIAWIVNVKLFPYPPKQGSLSYWWIARRIKKTERRITSASSAEHPKKWVSIWGDAVSVARTGRNVMQKTLL